VKRGQDHDPRSLLISRHKSVQNDYFYHADFQYFLPKGKAPTLTNPGLLPTHAAIRMFRAALAKKQWMSHVVAYEKLIQDPDMMQKQISQTLRLAFHRRFSEINLAAVDLPMKVAALNGVRQLESSRLLAWRRSEYRMRIRDQFTRFPELFRVMREMGYSWGKDDLEEYGFNADRFMP
jgi:hypothetical protein